MSAPVPSRVALRAGGGRRTNLEGVLQDIDDQIAWKNYRRIVIKPNFVSTTNQLAATHVEAVRVLLEHVRNRFDSEVWLIEGGAGHDRFCGFINFGYEKLVDEFQVHLQEIGKGETVLLGVFDHTLRPMQVKVDKRMLESEFIISISPPKIHDTVVFTATLKNVIMGSLVIDRVNIYRKSRRVFRQAKRWSRNLWDAWWPGLVQRVPKFVRRTRLFSDIDFWLIRAFNEGDSRLMMHQTFPVMNLDLYILARRLHPHLSIIDGYEAMHGDGPIDGSAATLKVAIASTDFVAADATAARIMGLDPNEVGYLWYCAEGGLGHMDQSMIELVGGIDLRSVARKLQRHTTHEQQVKWRSEEVLKLFRSLSAVQIS